MKSRLASAVLLATFLTAGAAEASDKPARRFALVVGSNASDGSRPELRYAVSDARAVAQVLEQLGGVDVDAETTRLMPLRRSITRTLLTRARVLPSP
jgi:hypothetical protein